MDAKEEVRARLLERRAARPENEVRLTGTELARRVLDLWDGIDKPGGRVAAYLSLGSEPPTSQLVDALRERAVDVIVPVVEAGGVLRWARYEGAAATAPNRYGIAEPTGPRLDAEMVDGAGLIVVPGLAVDLDGHRLGRGGGYYDRALVRVGAGARRVILVYDDEVLDDVPHESHDQRVDVAVTPTRTLPLRNGAATV